MFRVGNSVLEIVGVFIMGTLSDIKPRGMLSLLILLFFLGGTLSPVAAQSPTNLTYGGTARDEGSSIVSVSDGGYAIAGQTRSYGLGNNDMYLIKTDANGNMQWNRTFGGLGEDYASDVVQSSDGGYVIVGYTDSYGLGGGDMYLVKTDQNGNMQWSKTIGGTSMDCGYSLTLTADGGYAIAGQTFSFGRGGDFYLVKTDPDGNAEWSRTYGGANPECPFSVIVTNDGGFALVGYVGNDLVPENANVYLVKTYSNGTPQWNRTYGGGNSQIGSQIVQTNDNSYVIVGTSGAASAGNFYLLKTNVNGTQQWTKTYGGTGDEAATSLVIANDGGFALAGYTASFGNGQRDIYLVKTDFVGNQQWTKTYGGTKNDQASSIVRIPLVGYAIAGFTESFGSGNTDVYLVLTDTSGTAIPEFSPIAMLLVFITIATLATNLNQKVKKRPNQTANDL